MTRTLNPAQLQALLHYFYSPLPYTSDFTGDVGKQLGTLYALGLICDRAGWNGTSAEARYDISPMGKAYVEHILETPLPVMKWEVPIRTTE